MKFCPMCGMPRLKAGLWACQFCAYEEKPLDRLSDTEINNLMGSYVYKRTEDGVRIETVRNVRDISLRGSVGIPHFVTEIAEGAFSCCKFLARIELPKGLRTIGDSAFAHCRDLFDVFIPASVSHIGRGVFEGCYDLGIIRVERDAMPDGWDSEWLFGCDARVEWSSTDEE